MYLWFPNILLVMYVVFSIAAPPYIAPYKDDLDDQEQYDPQDPNKMPKFMTKPNVYRVVVKDTVVLPCDVYNPDNLVLAWRKGIAILTAGTTKVMPEERYRIVEGYNLEIRNAHVSDAGNYTCQIGTLNTLELKHILHVLIPPRIIGVTSNGKVCVKSGMSVTLECNATGNPKPTITWIRKNDMLPCGKDSATGSTYTINGVRRTNDGVYICSASNNIGEPVTEQIDLKVMYPPDVKPEYAIVFSAEGRETEIVCIIHAEPDAEVLWYKDTLQLDMNEWRIMEFKGNRYTLRIRKVQNTDFGNYSCVADNGLGRTRRFVELSGKPDVAVFTSTAVSNTRDSYNISWKLTSYSPIQEYKLLYRPFKNSTKSIKESHYKRPMQRVSTARFSNDLKRTINNFLVSTRYDDWNEILVNPQRTDVVDQAMSQMITSLEPITYYEATVQSRNRYGWSEISKSFSFSTLEKNEVPAGGKSVLRDPELRGITATTSAVNNTPETIRTLLLCVMIVAIIFLA